MPSPVSSLWSSAKSKAQFPSVREGGCMDMDRIILYPTLQGQGLEGVGRGNSSCHQESFLKKMVSVLLEA